MPNPLKNTNTGHRAFIWMTLMSVFFFVLFIMILGWQKSKVSHEPNTIEWTTHTDAVLNYQIQIPDHYTAERDTAQSETLWRNADDSVKVLTRFRSPDDNQSLWFNSTSVGRISLGDVDGERYIYRHCEGPSCSRTIAYVIPLQDKFFALEFRTDQATLDETERYILDSFTFTKAGQ